MKITEGKPVPRVSVSATVNVSHNTTKEQFELATANIPANATMSIYTYKADRPGESSYSKITYTWTI